MEFDAEVTPQQLLSIVCGIICGYLIVTLAIDIAVYYHQSKVVVGRMYISLRDAEKPSQFREGQPTQQSVTFSRQPEQASQEC